MIHKKHDTRNGLLRNAAPRQCCHSSKKKLSILVMIFLLETAKLRKFEPHVIVAFVKRNYNAPIICNLGCAESVYHTVIFILYTAHDSKCRYYWDFVYVNSVTVIESCYVYDVINWR
jgi:hypothetical protein